MDKQITFVAASDWVAMYVNGIKVCEGHSLHYSHVLDALGIQYTQQSGPKEEMGTYVDFTDRIEDITLVRYEE